MTGDDAHEGATVAMILGVPVDDVTMDDALDRILELVDDGRRRGCTHQVSTVNVDFVVNAMADAELATTLRRSALSIPDGMPIVWMSRMIGRPLRERVTGADLVPALVERAAQRSLVVSLYGAGPGVAEAAASLLGRRFPGARVVGDGGPSFRRIDELGPADVEPLRQLSPDICCVAFGNPKQEQFIARFGAELGIPVMIGVGGTLDFLVGEKRRAPAWMQRVGLEWLHRAITEPRRLAARYLRDAMVYGPAAVRQARAGRRSIRRGEVDIADDDGRLVVDLTGLTVGDNRLACDVAGAVRRARRTARTVEVRGDVDSFGRVAGMRELLRDDGG